MAIGMPWIRCQSPKYENGFLPFMALGVAQPDQTVRN